MNTGTVLEAAPAGEDDRLGSTGDIRQAGIVDLGPTEDHFTSVYGGNLGKLPGTYFGGDAEPGYTSLGRLRVTVERVEEPAAPGA